MQRGGWAKPTVFGAPRACAFRCRALLGATQQNLHRLGLSRPLDDLQVSRNRAAETTMPQAGRLFESAVRSMTVGDAIAIARGDDDSAPNILRGRTSPATHHVVDATDDRWVGR